VSVEVVADEGLDCLVDPVHLLQLTGRGDEIEWATGGPPQLIGQAMISAHRAGLP
jgi:hypothetical protein